MEIFETEQELINAIIEFNNDANVQRLQNFYNSSAFPDILGVGRRELSHSAFLAWLFDISASHGLGAAPVLQLLELFVVRSREQDKGVNDALMKAILSRSITINNTVVKTENSVAKGRADIVIDIGVGVPDANPTISKLRIVIENKVYSNEHDKQTCTYYKYYETEKQEGEQICYIYLTPLLHEKDAKCESFVHITYQDLLDNVFEPILLSPDLSERTRFILTEYINCLSIPVEEFTGDNKKSIKQTTIMAISENERSLLNAFWKKHEKLIEAISKNNEQQSLLDAFWKKHEKLIVAAATMIKADRATNAEQKTVAEKLLDLYKQKDYSKYSVNGEGSYGKGPMVKRVIECYLEMQPNVTIEELKTIFPDKLQGAGLGVIRSNTDSIRDKSRYKESKHPRTGEKFYICSQWYKNENRNNIENFIKYVNENILNIKIVQIE